MKTSAVLTPAKRRYLRGVFIDGIAAPPVLPDDEGITRHHYPDPFEFLRKTAYTDPKKFEALLKDRVLALEHGALAGPVVDGFDGLVNGRHIICYPQFLLPQGEFKVRCITNLSAKPTFSWTEATLDPFDPRAGLSFNASFTHKISGCSFPEIRDKAALIASFPGGAMILNDLSGYYYQVPSDPREAHLKGIAFWWPGRELDEETIALMRACFLGGSGNTSGAHGGHGLLLEAGDKNTPERLSTSNYCGPAFHGLKVDKRPFTELLPKKSEVRRNFFKFVHSQGMCFALWKTGARTMVKYAVHVDDVGIADWTPKDALAVRDWLRTEIYKPAGLRRPSLHA